MAGPRDEKIPSGIGGVKSLLAVFVFQLTQILETFEYSLVRCGKNSVLEDGFAEEYKLYAYYI